MDRIYRYRMTTTSGGNLSIRDEDGIWITPARIDKGALRRSDIVRVAEDGSWRGEIPPSSELPLHQAVYRLRPDVRAIVHAHPVALVAFSVVHQVPDTRVLHQARTICGEGGFAPYRLPGSAELGESVASALERHDCVILENHGVVTVGADLDEAFRRFETFEFTGKTIVKARLLGCEPRALSDDDLAGARRGPRLGTADSRPQPTNAEREARAGLREFVRRGYRQRLFTSTHGTFSARIDESSFVITPHHADRAELEIADLVLVSQALAEPGSRPSHLAPLHAAIYREQPGIGAIVDAAPVNVTAFGICGLAPDTRTIPESRLVVRSPVVAPFRLQFEAHDELAQLVSLEQPVVLLENDGVLVVGSGMLEAFDRLEVLESTAEALLNARPLGSLEPMSDAVIAELERAFFA
jgi:L-fuculose-phosphate aldolase